MLTNYVILCLYFFQNRQKIVKHLGYFLTKFAAKNLFKMPNVVALMVSHKIGLLTVRRKMT